MTLEHGLIGKGTWLSPSPPTAHPIHAGVPEPLHPALRVSPGRHLLCHTCIPRGPLAPGHRVLLHPEVLPSGIQVTADLPASRVEMGVLQWGNLVDFLESLS